MTDEDRLKQISEEIVNVGADSEWMQMGCGTISTAEGRLIEVTEGAEHLEKFIQNIPAHMRFLLEHIRKLTDALQFYAPELRYGSKSIYINPLYREHFPITVAEDRGQRARKALEWD